MNIYKAVIALLIILNTTEVLSQQTTPIDTLRLNEQEAGSVVTPYIETLSDAWQHFTQQEIDDAIFKRIKNLSYKEGCKVELEQLRYIRVLHYNHNGEIAIGEMICNKSISGKLLSIFKNLFEAGYKIEKMVLIDNYGADDNLSMADNNSSCFNYRTVAGTSRLSKHSLGLAVDINPLYNPYVKSVAGSIIVEPKEGEAYADRDSNFHYKIDTNDLCYKEFTAHGFIWGGSWRSIKDYQHFEIAQ